METVVIRVPVEWEPLIRRALVKYRKQKQLSDRQLARRIGRELFKKIA